MPKTRTSKVSGKTEKSQSSAESKARLDEIKSQMRAMLGDGKMRMIEFDKLENEYYQALQGEIWSQMMELLGDRNRDDLKGAEETKYDNLFYVFYGARGDIGGQTYCLMEALRGDRNRDDLKGEEEVIYDELVSIWDKTQGIHESY
jgi:hypothetical protein